MVDLLNDYLSISETIKATVDEALGSTIKDKLIYCIQDKATEEVYSYSPKVINSRRETGGGLIDPNNMETEVENQTLTLTNITGLQNLFGGSDSSPLTPIVEDGVKAYFQPEPRPFMDEALNKLVDEGIADRELAYALIAAGFEVTVS